VFTKVKKAYKTGLKCLRVDGKTPLRETAKYDSKTV